MDNDDPSLVKFSKDSSRQLTSREYIQVKRQKLQDQENENLESLKQESNIFSGLKIYINGYTDPPAKELKKLILEHGGSNAYYYKPKSGTIYVAAELALQKKIQVAKSKSFTVIHPSWITECIEKNQLLPKSSFEIQKIDKTFYDHIKDPKNQTLTQYLKKSKSFDSFIGDEEQQKSFVHGHLLNLPLEKLQNYVDEYEKSKDLNAYDILSQQESNLYLFVKFNINKDSIKNTEESDLHLDYLKQCSIDFYDILLDKYLNICIVDCASCIVNIKSTAINDLDKLKMMKSISNELVNKNFPDNTIVCSKTLSMCYSAGKSVSEGAIIVVDESNYKDIINDFLIKDLTRIKCIQAILDFQKKYIKRVQWRTVGTWWKKDGNWKLLNKTIRRKFIQIKVST